jgi:hypothetical protein
VATKKQQRRRQKQMRHEYEEVYVDETGRELDPGEAEELVGSTGAKKTSGPARSRAAERGRRAVEPPSWRRTGRRALLFFPLMLGVVFLLSPELSVAAKVFNTVVLMGFFLPFSYFMDSMMWRSYQRRLERAGEKKP